MVGIAGLGERLPRFFIALAAPARRRATPALSISTGLIFPLISGELKTDRERVLSGQFGRQGAQKANNHATTCGDRSSQKPVSCPEPVALAKQLRAEGLSYRKISAKLAEA